MASVRTMEVIDSLLAQGRIAVSTEEAAQLLGVPSDHVRIRMQPLIHGGKVFSPARGLWVAIPPQYRTWRVIPGIQFIDFMMARLDRDYYVGWLSAAELHGAAHQRPQVLQIAVDRGLADRDIARVRLRFTERRHLADLPRMRHSVPTGQIWISTPEVTALDLAANTSLGGGVSNVATVFAELADQGSLDAGLLAQAAEHYSLATVRRLGFLLERVDGSDLTLGLHEFCEQRRRFPPDRLAVGSSQEGKIDSRWRLLVNSEVEPDL